MDNQQSFNSVMKQLEDTLDVYFRQKLPALPANIKELLVNIAPWLVVVGLVLGSLGLLSLLGIGSYFRPFVGYSSVFNLATIFLIIILILEALAIPGLRAKTKQGWRYIFYASLVAFAQNIIRVDVIGAILGAIISFYILFQVREYYK